MKIIIEEIKETSEEYVLFHVSEIDQRISKAIHYIENIDTYLIGKENEKIYKVEFENIYYIETVDKKSFLYTGENVLASSKKLYQLEDELLFADFIRISKSMLLNINKVETVYPTISGRFEAKLSNQEIVTISRSYIPDFKRKLGVGGK